MQVGINIAGVLTESGIDNFGRCLFDHLTRIDTNNTYYLYQWGRTGKHKKTWWDKSINVLREQVYLPAKVYTQKLDVLHSIKNHGLPVIHASRYVLTLCDLIPLIYTDIYLPDKMQRKMFLLRLKLAVQVADKIVTLSEFSKQDIIKILGLSADKITVIPPGIDRFYRKLNEPALIRQVKDKYTAGEDFILGFGADEPRKNSDTLITAFAKFKSIQRSKHKLIIVGRKWVRSNPKIEKVLRQVKTSLGNDIIFTGHLSDHELLGLYNGAEMMVFPSIYEGFGLPVLEAMSCGVPVITSECTSLPEVGGDAVLKINPYDSGQIADKMNDLFVDNSLRRQLINKGYLHVKKFNWDNSVRKMVKVYQTLIR